MGNQLNFPTWLSKNVWFNADVAWDWIKTLHSLHDECKARGRDGFESDLMQVDALFRM